MTEENNFPPPAATRVEPKVIERRVVEKRGAGLGHDRDEERGTARVVVPSVPPVVASGL